MTKPELSIPAALAELEGLAIPELKERWRTLFDGPAPPCNRAFLIRRLSYRIQELRLGGLEGSTRARLKAMAKDYDGPAARKTIARHRPPVGTRLVRTWKGVAHIVTVTRDGFEFEGRPYATLTPIARRITGTSWNGPQFFGLERKAQ